MSRRKGARAVAVLVCPEGHRVAVAHAEPTGIVVEVRRVIADRPGEGGTVRRTSERETLRLPLVDVDEPEWWVTRGGCDCDRTRRYIVTRQLIEDTMRAARPRSVVQPEPHPTR